MDAYIYRAAMYCEHCAQKIIIELEEEAAYGKPIKHYGDSEWYPQGPYQQGGGESDSPQHCDNCQVFLQNPLTSDGEDYVRKTVRMRARWYVGVDSVVQEWKEYYSYLWE